MANITELTEVTAVAGTDVLYCVQGSNDRKLTASQLATYINDNIVCNSLQVGNESSSYETTGPELITNGGFSGNANGWTLGADATYADGAVTIIYTENNEPSLQTTFSSVTGQNYLLTFDITSVTNDGGYVDFSSISNEPSFFKSGTYEFIITGATTGTETITFYPWKWVIGGGFVIDNVSIKALTNPSNFVVYDNGGNVSIKFYRQLENIQIGYNALSVNTTGFSNLAIGDYALFSNTTGYYNNAVGNHALASNVGGNFNTAYGCYSLAFNESGGENVAIGYSSLVSCTGTRNSSVGCFAGFSNSSGSSNTIFGIYSLYYNETGSGNIAIGYEAGDYQADGSTGLTSPERSIYIGYKVRGKDNNDSNSIVIGNQSISLGANTTVLGNSSTTLTRLFGNIATGTDTPSAAIHAIKTTEQLRLGYDASNYASFTVSSAGVLTLTTSANKIALGASRTPASATDTGTAGEVCWDANYVYVCVAANTWRRAALSSW